MCPPRAARCKSLRLASRYSVPTVARGSQVDTATKSPLFAARLCTSLPSPSQPRLHRPPCTQLRGCRPRPFILRLYCALIYLYRLRLSATPRPTAGMIPRVYIAAILTVRQAPVQLRRLPIILRNAISLRMRSFTFRYVMCAEKTQQRLQQTSSPEPAHWTIR